MAKYLLGIDFGGGSSKATLLSEGGEIVCTASEEYPMHHPHIGWAEQDPGEIYAALVRNVNNILAYARAQAGVRAEEIVALALDAGTHIPVLLDEQGAVIRPAIYWSDTRSKDEAARFQEQYGKRIMELACNGASSIWTLPQLEWIRVHEPENFARIHKVLFLKDYLRFRLTGVYATDSVDAMGALLMDAEKTAWSEWLCSLCGIRIDQLPPIVPPYTVIGPPLGEACAATGLSEKTLIVTGATDTVMEVYASGAIHTGQATLKLATAGRICPITAEALVDPRLVCYRHIIPGLWYPGTATKSCAASMRWYRDVLSPYELHLEKEMGVSAYRQIDEAAARIPPGAEGVFFHPYLQGEITPYLDDSLKASFTGVSSYHTKAHFGRAVMEGVAYSLRDCMEVLYAMGVELKDTVRIIGGGSKSPLWRQIVADVLQIPLQIVKTDDSSIGSAMLAGVASGVFASYEESVARCTQVGETITPNQENKTIYDNGFYLYQRMQEALAPVYQEMYG